MILLSAEKLEKNFGERILFSDLNIALEKGVKAALIAANGTGKTSLLRILAGKDEPDGGSIALTSGIRIALLEQEPDFTHELTIDQQVKKSSNHINSVISRYEDALSGIGSLSLEEATAEMDIYGGWDYERRLGEMLDRFGITETGITIGTLSGGQLKRLALALALMDKPDLLLLDEPTNHLDIDMIEWLEDYLSRNDISFLMVTHDRYFLDQICNVIFELENQKLYTHPGNYENYLRNKEERELAEEAEISRSRTYVRNELEWMRRMPKARTGKAKSRIDSFNENYVKSKNVKEKKELKMDVKSSRIGGKILDLKNIHHSFDEEILIDDFSYNFKKGEKVGIIGPNGSGKSSLLNIITGNLKPDKGIIETGETIKFSYYRQEGLIPDDNKKVIDVVTEIAEVIETGKGKTITASQLLNHFMFPPKVQHQTVATLSGGEKRRLYLLSVLIGGPNFILLDEPTNDLDILTLQKLEEFLENYSGCLLIVSHDRFLLDRICDTLIIFDGKGSVNAYVGHYSEYRESVKQSLIKESEAGKSNKKKQAITITKSRTEKKGLTFKEKSELDELENSIPVLEMEKADLEKLISSGNLDYQELNSVTAQINLLMEKLSEMELRWLELDDKKNS